MVAEVLENRKDVVHVSGAEQRRLHRNRRGQFGALIGIQSVCDGIYCFCSTTCAKNDHLIAVRVPREPSSCSYHRWGGHDDSACSQSTQACLQVVYSQDMAPQYCVRCVMTCAGACDPLNTLPSPSQSGTRMGWLEADRGCLRGPVKGPKSI